LGKAIGEIKFTTEGLFEVYDVNDLLIKKSIDILQINASSLKAEIRIFPQAKIFEFRGIKYRGQVILRPVGDSIFIINEVPLEKYLLSVVPSEMPTSWQINALKAQAICARTYVIREILNKKNAPYDVDTTTASQVYGGVGKENPNSTEAVEETEGMILVFDKEPIHAFFHSNAGKETEVPENVWNGKPLPYLRHVSSEYDDVDPKYSWTEKISFSQMDTSLSSLGIGGIRNIFVLGRNKSNRVELLEVVGSSGSKKVKGVEFRKLLGYTKLRSLKFGIIKESDHYFIKGLGNGHGVGMSQWGAKGMADAGYNYRKILEHYYPGAEVANIIR
jgi:stage II sporulation protein D